jgi:zinc transport system permease protein
MFRVNPRGIGMTEWLDDFVVRAVIAGLIMVAIAAPMGCLMVWQRLAFLSDTLGHAAVMGVGLGLLLQVQPIFGVLAVALLIVFSLSRVTSFNTSLSETTLAIISHTGLAGGIILVGLLPAHTVNLEAILFGDLLATTIGDLATLLVTTVLLLFVLLHHWRSFVAVSVSREIAQAEGIEVRKVQFLMYIMIALLVAVMMKVMGVLLIAAMLVIPTTSALWPWRARRRHHRLLPVRLADRSRHRRQRHPPASADPRRHPQLQTPPRVIPSPLSHIRLS